jgi:uncharacterized protein
MTVVSMVLEVGFEGCTSAKQRRAEADAILGRLRRHFNVSIVELNPSATDHVAALGFATIARTRREARELLKRVADAVAAHPRAEILKAHFEDY